MLFFKFDFFQQNGELRRHRQLRIGWFDQHSNEALNGEQTAADYLCTKFNIDLQVFIFSIYSYYFFYIEKKFC